MSINNSYEQLDHGFTPRVFIREDVFERAGEPDINYGQLGVLFEEELQLPAEQLAIKIYDGGLLGHINSPLDKWRKWYHVPFTNTLHIAAYDSTSRVMDKVIGAGIALSEARNRRGFLLKERAIAVGPYVGGVTLGLTGIGVEAPAAGAAGSVITGRRYENRKLERRNEKSEELLRTHSTDIQFPRPTTSRR